MYDLVQEMILRHASFRNGANAIWASQHNYPIYSQKKDLWDEITAKAVNSKPAKIIKKKLGGDTEC